MRSLGCRKQRKAFFFTFFHHFMEQMTNWLIKTVIARLIVTASDFLNFVCSMYLCIWRHNTGDINENLVYCTRVKYLNLNVGLPLSNRAYFKICCTLKQQLFKTQWSSDFSTFQRFDTHNKYCQCSIPLKPLNPFAFLIFEESHLFFPVLWRGPCPAGFPLPSPTPSHPDCIALSLSTQPFIWTWWLWGGDKEVDGHFCFLLKATSSLHSCTFVPHSIWDAALRTSFIAAYSVVSRALRPYPSLQKSTYLWGVTELKYEGLCICTGVPAARPNVSKMMLLSAVEALSFSIPILMFQYSQW